MRAALQHAVAHDGAGGLGERGELTQRVLDVVLRPLRVDADEHDVLEPQLAVLDLGDVFELGRQPRDAPHRRALLALQLVAVVGVEVGVALVPVVGVGQRGGPGVEEP